MHMITHKASKKYIINIWKDRHFSPSGRDVRNLQNKRVITFFHQLHFKTLWTYDSSGAWVVGDKEITSGIWSSFPECSVCPQKTDFHTYELSHHNYPLMAYCSFPYSSVYSSKYYQPLSDDKLQVRLMDQNWKDERRKSQRSEEE